MQPPRPKSCTSLSSPSIRRAVPLLCYEKGGASRWSSAAGREHDMQERCDISHTRIADLGCAGAGLAEPAGDDGGAVCRRRADGHARAHSAADTGRSAGPAHHHREPARRRRHDRARFGCRRRRPTATVRARLDRHPCDRLFDAQEAAYHPAQRFPAGDIHRRRAAAADDKEGSAAEQPQGVHGLHQGQPRQDDVRPAAPARPRTSPA